MTVDAEAIFRLYNLVGTTIKPFCCFVDYGTTLLNNAKATPGLSSPVEYTANSSPHQAEPPPAIYAYHCKGIEACGDFKQLLQVLRRIDGYQ